MAFEIHYFCRNCLGGIIAAVQLSKMPKTDKTETRRLDSVCMDRWDCVVRNKFNADMGETTRTTDTLNCRGKSGKKHCRPRAALNLQMS